ncbi:MAG: hypothetical protein V3S68_03395 [Dehalococcoidia bacterium]
MPRTFKVWIHIEEYDEERQPNESIDVGLPEQVAEVELLADAEKIAAALNRYGEQFLMGVLAVETDWLAEGQQLTFGGH